MRAKEARNCLPTNSVLIYEKLFLDIITFVHFLFKDLHMYVGLTESHDQTYFILKQRNMYRNRYHLELLEIPHCYSMKSPKRQAYLPVLHNLEHATAVEVCFSILQPYIQGPPVKREDFKN
jgi:ubiquitin-protein ligase